MTSKEQELYKKCSQLLDDGEYTKAISLAASLQTPVYKAAIYIDGGYQLKKSVKVQEGINIFEDILNSTKSDDAFTKYSLFYNLANGYISLFKIRASRRRSTIPPNDEDLRKAKYYYRESLEAINESSGSFISQIWVNYGNCLSLFGRYIDAIDCYENALKADPNNGMAAGNLAVELKHSAWLTTNYRHEYLAVAFDLIDRVFNSEMHLKFGSYEAIIGFKDLWQELKGIIDLHEEPIYLLKTFKKKTKNKYLDEYVEFCIDNKLMLNPWVGNNEISPGYTDNIAFGPIVTNVGDNYLVPELLNILDEIKESFSTARYIYYKSHKEDIGLDNISQMTQYHGIDQFSLNSLYIGLCKTAYSQAFNILDKVGQMIHVYFKIGNRRDSFWNIFATKQSLGKEHKIRYIAKPEICEFKNYGLFALADLCIDYFESEHVDLRTIDSQRNQITHDYLNVKLFNANEGEENENKIIGLVELYSQTKKVLILAKYAVLYAIFAITIEEEIKSTDKGSKFNRTFESRPGQTFL